VHFPDRIRAGAAKEILRLLRGICLQEQIVPDEEVLRKIAEETGGKPRVASISSSRAIIPES